MKKQIGLDWQFVSKENQVFLLPLFSDHGNSFCVWNGEKPIFKGNKSECVNYFVSLVGKANHPLSVVRICDYSPKFN